MAVSNAVGSNVFDILICLGLPWFIQTAMIKPGSHVNVYSKGTVMHKAAQLLLLVGLPPTVANYLKEDLNVKKFVTSTVLIMIIVPELQSLSLDFISIPHLSSLTSYPPKRKLVCQSLK